VAAAIGGWLPQKLGAWRETLHDLPRLRRERRAIQAGARIDASEFAAALTAELDSEYLGRVSRSPLLRALLSAYWRVARRLL
jgi:hypothetical protein